MKEGLAIGVDIGGGSIRVGVYNVKGVELRKAVSPTPKNLNNDSFLNTLKTTISAVWENNESYTGIGVGSPGPLDNERGIFIASANMKGINNVPIKDFLEREFKIPCSYENDANCAALGEAYFGNFQSASSLLILTLGTGLGGGFVEAGKLYSGYLGNGIEIGHTTAVFDGRLCGCGQRGCVEAYFSTEAFKGSYLEKTGTQLKDAKEFFERLDANDPIAFEILKFGTLALAHAVRGAIHLLNPEAVVFVGGITNSYNKFGVDLESRIRSLIFPILNDRLKIGVGSGFSGSLGAAGLVFSKRGIRNG
ncbi:MAG: ROK family protein [Leptospira sp.]|nr:ROK family protein [Leptospira sp.]